MVCGYYDDQEYEHAKGCNCSDLIYGLRVHLHQMDGWPSACEHNVMGQCFFCSGWGKYEPCSHQLDDHYCYECFLSLHKQHQREVTIPSWLDLFESKEQALKMRASWGANYIWEEVLRQIENKWP